jgi:integrase
MARERALSDAKLRTATRAADGPYLNDGGGLRFRLSDPTDNYVRGARLAEYRYKLKDSDGRWCDRSMYLGTIGEPYADPETGKMRPFTLADARAERDSARAKVSRGIDPREARRLLAAEEAERQRSRLAELDSRRTVRDAFKSWSELYLEARNQDGAYANRKDGGAAVRDLFGLHVLPRLGDRTIDTIETKDVTGVLDALTAAGKRRSANMALSLLRQFFRWCVVRQLMRSEPTLNISRRDAGGKEVPRERSLSELEIVELRHKLAGAKMPERMREGLWLLLATGVRAGELAGAPFSEFDLDAAVWKIPGERTKSGGAHTVHLSAFALARVVRLRALAGDSDWLLPGRVPAGADRGVGKPISPKYIAKQVNDRQRTVPLKRRSKASGALLLSGGEWTPHDLRRTMASRMQDMKVPPHVIEKCLNHRLEGILAVYQTAELLDERRAAFDTWGAKLEELMAVAAPDNVTALPDRAARQARIHAKAA